MHAIDEGQGAPAVLLHSAGMASGEWSDHVPGLAERFRVIAPDLPGHGRTVFDGRLSIQAMARAVTELLDAKGIGRAHIIGSSMGGAVAQRLALTQPDRVDRLVLFRSNHYPVGGSELADPDLWRGMGLEHWMSRTHEPQGGPEAWLDVIDRVAAAMAPGTSDHGYELHELAGIGSPTLLVAGDRDPVVPIDDLVAMYGTIPNAALWVMPNADHIPATNTWRRSAFIDEVSRFLRTRHP